MICNRICIFFHRLNRINIPIHMTFIFSAVFNDMDPLTRNVCINIKHIGAEIYRFVLLCGTKRRLRCVFGFTILRLWCVWCKCRFSFQTTEKIGGKRKFSSRKNEILAKSYGSNDNNNIASNSWTSSTTWAVEIFFHRRTAIFFIFARNGNGNINKSVDMSGFT